MRKKRAPRNARATAGRAGAGCLFWLCLAAVLIAIAIAARKPLENAFARLFKGTTGEPGEPPRVVMEPLPEKKGEGGSVPSPAKERTTERVRDTRGSGETPQAAGDQKTGVVRTEEPRVRRTRLFFVSVDQDGRILVKGVIRSIPSSDSPLKDTIETLLKGPTSEEISLNLLTMIPTDARLLSASVRKDTAFLDFSENFRFNPLGIGALTAQLRQVVYAATEFPTVKKVQILIEGRRVASLETEGMAIDQPLSRSSFQD